MSSAEPNAIQLLFEHIKILLSEVLDLIYKQKIYIVVL